MTCGDENDTNGCHLAVFSVHTAFAHHFVAPLTLHFYRSTSGIGYASKKLSKMTGSLANRCSPPAIFAYLLDVTQFDIFI